MYRMTLPSLTSDSTGMFMQQNITWLENNKVRIMSSVLPFMFKVVHCCCKVRKYTSSAGKSFCNFPVVDCCLKVCDYFSCLVRLFVDTYNRTL